MKLNAAAATIFCIYIMISYHFQNKGIYKSIAEEKEFYIKPCKPEAKTNIDDVIHIAVAKEQSTDEIGGSKQYSTISNEPIIDAVFSYVNGR